MYYGSELGLKNNLEIYDLKINPSLARFRLLVGKCLQEALIDSTRYGLS